MSAISQRIQAQEATNPDTTEANAAFLKAMPTIKTHARIQFRHLPKEDRENAVAESIASAYVNFRKCRRNGTSHRITPYTLAHYAILRVKDGRHVGGSTDSKKDVMSLKAQRLKGFRVIALPWDSEHAYNCLTDPTSPVWGNVLLDDKSTPVLDQAAFRIDWSMFLGQQTDRTRQCISLLAEGHKRCEVADRMGTTPPAVTQRMARVEREWDRFQGIAEEETDEPATQVSCQALGPLPSA